MVDGGASEETVETMVTMSPSESFTTNVNTCTYYFHWPLKCNLFLKFRIALIVLQLQKSCGVLFNLIKGEIHL